MVCSDDLQNSGPQSLPESLLVLGGPNRWGDYKGGRLEIGLLVDRLVQQQVLGTGFSVDLPPRVLGLRQVTWTM